MRVALPKLLAMLLPALVAFLRKKTTPQNNPETQHSNHRENRPSRTGDDSIDQAFARGQSDLVLTESATVIRELADDTVGDKHQRILVVLDSGLTVLIAHNIDLARRVSGLRRGKPIRFRGEYEFNSKGGVMHWTHHDPKGWHEDGWIEYAGELYG